VELDGILRIEHTPWPEYTRVRVFFLAHPERDVLPKSAPDEESQGAAWFTLEELEKLELRDQEVLTAFRHAAAGAPVCPLTFWTQEGASWSG
jgi:phosphatase NudJ